ncbi:MAG: AAA family ATPase [Lachnospiraceae bacterium]|nr:AAA family ATPase [Lachnospiraceae bacterium]
MQITVAGAGAGKTSGLAEKIISDRNEMPQEKIIYCIAFTNNAADSIRDRLLKHYGEIPHSIKVATIHSFLYEEIIHPYYFALFGIQYKGISVIELDAKPAYRNNKIKELENKELLHIETIPERAKWVVSKKSSDKKADRIKRKIILDAFNEYCGKIFVDEAQDIDVNVQETLLALDALGIDIELYGDPKQDLRGNGCFRKLIDKFKENIIYWPQCYRCPAKHLLVSNSLINTEEQQYSEKTDGHLSIIFESELEDMDVSKYDLKYIYRRNDRFETHRTTDSDVRFQTLMHEVSDILESLSNLSETGIKIASYFYATKMLKMRATTDNTTAIISRLVKQTRALSKTEYAKLAAVLDADVNEDSSEAYQVNSIESIKGLEGFNCLFILTTDLAPYLFKEKCQNNKIKNALYVALTRSLDSLTILVTREVEEQYSHDKFGNYFKNLLMLNS